MAHPADLAGEGVGVRIPSIGPPRPTARELMPSRSRTIFNATMPLLNSQDTRPLAGETVGILAGWGRYPVVVAEAIRRHGGRTAILAIRDHADAALEPLADVHGEVGVAEIGKAIDFFRSHGVRRATMAGKIHKTTLFARAAWLRHLPDWVGLQTFWPHFVSRRRDNRDDSLLGAISATFDARGVTICPATDFAPELLAGEGLLAGKPLTARQAADVAFGWRLAKELGRLDIGQTVVVRNRAPLALEAIEGTDECIRRAGSLCPAGGMTVVKVAKPQQDLRFDMPTIGIGTLESLAAAGA
ncbi:LpxI family protein, partial [bacterium]|nr:LpxI family protein [bacterium]